LLLADSIAFSGMMVGILEVGAIRSQFTPNHRRISISALALAPLIFATARDHISWGANAYSQTAVGAVWNIADAQSKQNHPCGQPPEYGLLRKRYRIGGELI